jgi:hypothetical protein
MKISKNTKNAIGLFIALIGLFVLFELYKNWSLKSNIETYAVFIGYVGGVGSGSEYFKFKTQENEKIEANCSTNLKLEIGDTVRIKYSIHNPMYIKVIDRNYKILLKE